MKERVYIFYRKLKAFLYGMRFILCRIFPVRKKRITVCAFEGKRGFCCNPKYLVTELHRRDPSYEFIWFVNDLSAEMPDYIRKVKNTPWNRAYYMSTAKVWIDNYRNPYGVRKRGGQYYLNVNHYTIAVKCTGLWRGDGFSPMAYLVSKNDSDMMDALVTDSVWCDYVLPKGMLFEGEFLRSGAPRCDVLYGDKSLLRKAFRKQNGIPEDAKVCLFAPTFREGARDGKRFVFSEEWHIDFAELLENLTKRFGGTWYLCVRVHPQLAASFKEYRNEAVQDRLIDESGRDDMYGILAAADAFITDYSSAVFEAGYAGIPAFIFADDIDDYTKARGNLWWTFPDSFPGYALNNKEMTPEMELTMPFPASTTNEELSGCILGFDEAAYRERLRVFHEAIGLVFDGKGSERAADWVEAKCGVRN